MAPSHGTAPAAAAAAAASCQEQADSDRAARAASLRTRSPDMPGRPGQIKGPTRHQSGDGTAKPAPCLGLDGCCPEPVPILPPPPQPHPICGCRRLHADPVPPPRGASRPAAACEPHCKPLPSRHHHCFTPLQSARPPSAAHQALRSVRALSPHPEAACDAPPAPASAVDLSTCHPPVCSAMCVFIGGHFAPRQCGATIASAQRRLGVAITWA